MAVRAPVFVLEPVHGFRLHRAHVHRIGDPIAIIVRIGAAVIVLELVDVFGDARACVHRVGHAVGVGVDIGLGHGVRAPVVVAPPVDRLGLVGAAIVHIEVTVAIVVRVGAAIVVEEAVSVFEIIRAEVVRVGDAVSIAVG